MTRRVTGAYYVRSVRGRLTGTEPEPFPVDGEDWFPVTRQTKLAWPDIRGLVQDEHEKLVAAVNGIGAGRARAALPASECFDLALGITCDAVYHAGQVQLIKRLHAG